MRRTTNSRSSQVEVELIKCVGQKGRKKGEFNDPRGIMPYGNQVYICDCNNHRIQVYDLDLNFVRSVGSHGKGRANFNKPRDAGPAEAIGPAICACAATQYSHSLEQRGRQLTNGEN